MPSQKPQTQSMYGSSSSSSNYSDNSTFSLSTIASSLASERLQLYKTIGNPHGHVSSDAAQDPHVQVHRPRISIETYASTTSSGGDAVDELPSFEVPEVLYNSPLTSTPEEFAEYFPSARIFSIRHDDTTADGNMNLRVDSEARTLDGEKIHLQLFHLRMYDLNRREFSLRRYSRDSGREVCHSCRKYTKPSGLLRPRLRRSMSNAFSSLRSKSESNPITVMSLKRHHSGYDFLHEDDIEEAMANQLTRPLSSTPRPTNTVQLEFSNYAHLVVKPRGPETCKRYEIEYWGTRYAWKRNVVKSDESEKVSHQLINTKTFAPLAHIEQIPLSESEQRKEVAKGGWVPPCKISFEDSVLDGSTDLADVVMASGLVALVDDCINRRWHQKGRMHFTVPSLTKSPLRLNMEHVEPKRLLDEVYNHREKSTARRPSPLRTTTC